MQITRLSRYSLFYDNSSAWLDYFDTIETEKMHFAMSGEYSLIMSKKEDGAKWEKRLTCLF